MDPHRITPQAQGDGDPAVWHLGTLPTAQPFPEPFLFLRGDFQSRRLTHVEVSGPAFAPIKAQLEHALQGQAWTAVGLCLDAIGRRCLLDLMPAWTRLLRLVEIEPSQRTRASLRRDWFWREAHSGLVTALCYCETDSARVKWIVADMVIRGEAAIYAQHAERSLGQLLTETATDLASAQDVAEMLRTNIAAYRAFAEGRA